jgi:hypothetical protein
MADLIITARETANGTIELLYEAQDFPDGVASTGTTATQVRVFFNQDEVELGTDQADVELVDGAGLLNPGGDVTADDNQDDDQSEETTQVRTLLLTDIPVDFDDEQTLLTLPVNTTDPFDGSPVNFDGQGPREVEVPDIEGITLEPNEPPNLSERLSHLTGLKRSLS